MELSLVKVSLNVAAKRRVLSATLLVLALGSASVHAETVIDRVVVVVDNTAILQSDVDAAIQEARGQLQARNQPIPIEST
ncbi:MAG: hypothetical protein WA154_00625, partial [Moraxellaceae bacterium]